MFVRSSLPRSPTLPVTVVCGRLLRRPDRRVLTFSI